MTRDWNQTRVQQYIDDETEESLNLDYKAADALSKQPKKKTEITKDVSAMANSDGGIIIYGVIEQNNFPSSIDSVNRNDFSKEWLEHVIGNIRPKIDGLLIHPVPIGNSTADVVYVVEIPKSHTAHQAMDKRYYKRFNFESVPMEHYEMLDVLNRQQHPRIEIELQIWRILKVQRGATVSVSNYVTGERRTTFPPTTTKKFHYVLTVIMQNRGCVYAHFVEARIELPSDLLFKFEFRNGIDNTRIFNLNEREIHIVRNTERDKFSGIDSSFRSNPYEGIERHVPVFAGLEMKAEELRLRDDFASSDWGMSCISWTTYADNAPPNSGEVAIREIPIFDVSGNQVELNIDHG